MNTLRDFLEKLPFPAALCSYNADDPVILECNSKHEKLSGYSSGEVAGNNPKMFRGPLTDNSTSEEIRKSLREHPFWRGTIVNYKKNGTPYTIKLTIMGVIIDGQKYYSAVKQLLKT